MANNVITIGRRGLLGVAIPAAVAAASWRTARADSGADAAAVPIQRLDAALLAAMKAGRGTAFSQRYASLQPVIDQTFDLNAVLVESVGLAWAGIPSEQKARLHAAFRRYTVASYAANFDNYTGQRFQIAPALRNVGNGESVVSTEIIASDGTIHKLDYVMRNTASGWKAVDVLADGSISRVAVQRSDFRHLLNDGGTSALVAGLQRKVASLSGGSMQT
ncbi:MAG TPA: ABC transporter substrate-binding protein [Acetobacteraceae bacterium]|jgi:phospholipid transport system substrate-binding protein